jgi:hypothetical protein
MASETGKVTTFKVLLPDSSVPDLGHFGSDPHADPDPEPSFWDANNLFFIFFTVLIKEI